MNRILRVPPASHAIGDEYRGRLHIARTWVVLISFIAMIPGTPLVSAHDYCLTQLQVVSISPSFNQIALDTQPIISVTFDQPVDTSTVTPVSFALFAERSAYKTGSFSYSSDRKIVSFTSSTPYTAGERVRVNLSRSIRAHSGDTLRGFGWTFRIPSARRNEYHFADEVVYSGGGAGVKCVDMNNDGHPDIVSSGGVIRLNDGSGVFYTVWTLPNADPWGNIVVDDFNRDGIMDVAYDGAGFFKIGLGDGVGNFSIQIRPHWLYGYATGDFNTDGYPDIAGIINDAGGRKWGILFNDGSGYFNDTVVVDSVSSGWLQTVEAFDVDNDGHLDILCAGWEIAPWPDEYGIIVWKANGRGGFGNPEVYLSTEFFWFPEQLYSSDFSNNSFTDIAVDGYAGYVSLNTAGTFGTDTASTRRFWPGEAPGALTGGDFNGDGWIDLAVTGYSIFGDPLTAYAIIPNCSGRFWSCVPFPGYIIDTLGYGRYVDQVQAVDVDNDGDLDLIHSYHQGAIYVNINTSPPVAVKDEIPFPQEFNLEQNFPNPFNPKTVIRYDLPRATHVTLRIYDLLGREITTLVDEMKQPGSHSVTWESSTPSGVYFARMTAGTITQTKKLILLR
jgi:hypothetical protein